MEERLALMEHRLDAIDARQQSTELVMCSLLGALPQETRRLQVEHAIATLSALDSSPNELMRVSANYWIDLLSHLGEGGTG